MPRSDYAAKHQVEMFVPGRGVGRYSLDGIWEDDSVDSPSEGSLDDHEVWDAIFDVLIAHSTDGPDTKCTAFYDPFWLRDPSTEDTSWPSVIKGRLGDHRFLWDSTIYDGPQNLWPNEHDWVLFTHLDAWATQISGSAEMIEALAASSILDTYRVADLP